MLIGCIGSHSTGKTTFVNAFVEAQKEGCHSGFHAVSSISRKVWAAGLDLNQGADRLSQMLTLFGRAVAEDTALEQYRNVITDRTPLDSLAYNEYQRRHVWSPAPVDELYQQITEDLVRQRIRKYDRLLYFPPIIGLEDDGIRDTDVQYQTEVDNLVRHYVKRICPWAREVPAGSVEERVEWFNAYL